MARKQGLNRMAAVAWVTGCVICGIGLLIAGAVMVLWALSKNEPFAGAAIIAGVFAVPSVAILFIGRAIAWIIEGFAEEN